MIPDSIIKKTTWFILDHEIFNYETLVKNYLKKHNVVVQSVPKLNISSPEKNRLKEKIQHLKKHYHHSHSKLSKNFLGADLRLYRTQILNQHLWDC
jgi:hypothetical protein